jgi:transposase
METFTMSRKEVPRAGLVKAALAGKITNAEGARALRISARQFRRLKQRVRTEGVRGLLHRRRGRPSPRRLAPALIEQVVSLMTTTYDGFNDVHLTEKLQERHALPISRAAVRRLRVALGRPARRRRRPPKHRSRRERAPALGQLVQLDASPFAWLETRGPAATLHGLIDDATSIPLALWFRPAEDLHGYLTILGQACRTYGVPVTLYGDRLNVFRRNDHHWTLAEQLRGAQDPTHFGRVLVDLGIGFIQAQSPQAKGRIERLWGTLQDRLVSELRLRHIATLAAANAFLPHFLADFAPRFARPPAQPAPAWRPAPRDLDRVLSCRYSRVVARDNTVTLGPRTLQIPPGPGRRSYAGCRVELRELLDGRLLALYQTVLLAMQPSPTPSFVLKPRRQPGEARRAEQRRRATDLRRAVAALARVGHASDPAPAVRRPLRASQSDDLEGGRHVTPPPVPTRKWRPAPTHPWRLRPRTDRDPTSRRTFSRSS